MLFFLIKSNLNNLLVLNMLMFSSMGVINFLESSAACEVYKYILKYN